LYAETTTSCFRHLVKNQVEDDAATVGITEHAQIISDFDAKLMVMLLGQYSTGKTTFPEFLFIMLGFGADGVPSSLVQTRTPPPSNVGMLNIACSTSGYSYTILKVAPLQFTRKGLSVASTSASLSFGILHIPLDSYNNKPT